MCYCAVFALFSFEFEGNFRVQAPGGLWRGDLSKGFFCITSLGGGGLLFGGATKWRGLFSEFYGMPLFNKAVLSKYDFSDRRGPLIFSTDPSSRISSQPF